MNFGSYSLLESVEREFGEDECAFIEDTFDSLLLPAPEEDEYGRTRDGGFLTFIEPYGCVIRVSSLDWPLFNHTHILQPLGFIEGKNLRVDINPGVITNSVYYNKNPQLAKNDPAGIILGNFLADKLLADGYDFVDCTNSNMAFLPSMEFGKDTGSPVVLEHAAVDLLHDFAAATRREMYIKDPAINPQEACFGDLISSFDKANAGGKLNSDKIQNFWEICLNKKQSGILTDEWSGAIFSPQDRNSQDTDIEEISFNYAKRLKKGMPHLG
jgi:hypothetical protein